MITESFHTSVLPCTPSSCACLNLCARLRAPACMSISATVGLCVSSSTRLERLRNSEISIR